MEEKLKPSLYEIIIVRHDKDWIIVSTKGKHMIIIEEVLDKNKK